MGGFFFLRFLIPALTAPEAYHLNVDEVTVNQRRLLVLVGKVLQVRLDSMDLATARFCTVDSPDSNPPPPTVMLPNTSSRPIPIPILPNARRA